MPVITRDDGVSFAVYTYREIIAAKRPSLLKRELEMLQEENGDYARFFGVDGGNIEAIFSREGGYLLAESVWEFFDQPENLLYCEAVGDGETVALVVIRDGNVALDSEVPVENLLDEFNSLSAGSNEYDIYIYGDIPLAEEPSEDHFSFDPSLVSSFNYLKESVFDQLEPNDELMLLPVAEAKREIDLSRSKTPLYIGILVVLLIGGYWFWSSMDQPAPVIEQPTQPQGPPPNPYAAYISALETPAPDAIINKVTSIVRQLYSIPGWEASGIKVTPASVEVDLKEAGGTTDLLLAWVQQNNANFSAQSGKASLTYSLDVANRDKPTKIYNAKDVVTQVYDSLRKVVAGSSVTIASPRDEGKYFATDMTVQFSEITPEIFELFANTLKGFPVVLKESTITLSSGLMSGTITISVLGAK
ncbi:MAG: hypothetical protein CMF50_09540 [Legionellales bacterium]|nr:hypothetical protein [Legionellales bacterium]|tara:strand:- start:181 stop:1431 length:1251 start_codon:yes stop_codon:yes gene_type:complete